MSHFSQILSHRIDTLEMMQTSCGAVGIGRNKFICQCIDFALQHMAPEQTGPQKPE